MTAKTCRRCKTTKPLDRFRKDKSVKDGRTGSCKDCLNAKQNQVNAANPGPNRKRATTWNQTNVDRRRAIVRKYSSNRRADTYAAAFGEVDWEAVRQSGTHCHICDCRLPKVRTPQNTHPDHLVALAAGGAHSARNLAPAHASCNRMRQDEPLPGLPGAWTIRPTTCSRSGVASSGLVP